VIILLLTGLPGSYLPKAKPLIGLDKLAHLIMYLGFAFITLWGYRQPYQEQGKAYQRKAIMITLAISLAFGALTEVMQHTLIPGRVGSLYDWIADAIGSLIGAVFFYFFFRNRNNLKNQAFCK
jgi:VanZ family protein